MKRRLFRGVVSIVLGSMVAACTRTLEVQVISQPDRGTLATRAEPCPARWYAADEPVAASCTEIGDVFVGDTGWSVDCGAERVQGEVRHQACLFGADAVQVIRDRQPSLSGSSCDQIRARFLKCPDAAALEGGR